jgi:predicted RNA-binding protein with PIN domain
MPYLIDGHNLIPKLPGLSLTAIDDELQLVEWLQAYCQMKQKDIEVFFDLSPHGYPPNKKFGRVKAHFIRKGTTADEAIEASLLELKGSAQNYIVVSSDHRVQAAARAVRARVVSSEEFARELINTRIEGGSGRSEGGKKDNSGSGSSGKPGGSGRAGGKRGTGREGESPSLSSDEVKEWENLFKRGKDGAPSGPKDSRKT